MQTQNIIEKVLSGDEAALSQYEQELRARLMQMASELAQEFEAELGTQMNARVRGRTDMQDEEGDAVVRASSSVSGMDMSQWVLAAVGAGARAGISGLGRGHAGASSAILRAVARSAGSSLGTMLGGGSSRQTMRLSSAQRRWL
jgi:hypothetical protein